MATEAGIAIVLLAIIFDRITQSYGERIQERTQKKKKDRWYKVYVYVDVEDLRDDEDKKEVEFRIGWIPEAEVGKI